MDKILVVDDDKDMRDTLSDIITAEGYEVTVAGDGRKALRKTMAHSPDVVLLDVRLPDMDGMKVLEEIRKIGNDIVVIMLTAYGGMKEAVSAMKLGAFDYVIKPFDNEELVLNIKKAIQTRSLTREVEDLRRKLQDKTAMAGIKGESTQIREVLNRVKIVAPTNMTVILQGESGTGKELIARLVHQSSLRHDKPFVVVDSGTLPENLMESELFGYERGAFTGAYERKTGKFESAHGGTLFLDEITNLAFELQAKLLRVIQERKIQHLGGAREITIDVRIIAATNMILADEVKKGRFRYDLYHRLNEFNIDIPPLRERKEDIPVLAKYFLTEANQEFNRSCEGISGEAMKSLLSCQWPGNIRELRNVVRKTALLTDSNYISEIELPFTGSDPEGFVFQGDLDEDATMAEIVKQTTESIERQLIRRALTQANYNKTRAARILKIDRMTLYSKIKSLGL